MKQSTLKRGNVAIFVPHLGCPHDCSFCNQRRISGQIEQPSILDVQAIAREGLKMLGVLARESELAFFGGSFTAIEPALMVSLLESAAPFVGENGFKGIRISTRPDAIDEERLLILKKYNVTAIELGAQSMDDGVLLLNRRGHTAADVINAARLIKLSGFELGLQMMTGLYGDTQQGTLKTAIEIAKLQPKTVRIYPTIVLEETLLAELYHKGEYLPQSLDDAVSLCAQLLEYFFLQGIKVIRLGLHASEGIENGRISGPWHPAFRELCENLIYLKKAEFAVQGIKADSAILQVALGARSKLTGQHRCNIVALEKEFGLHLSIIEGKDIPIYDVVVKKA